MFVLMKSYLRIRRNGVLQMNKVSCAIGENIRFLREYHSVSKSQLEKHLGCNRGAVSKWESGEHAPSAYYLFAIAKLFCVSIDRLYWGFEKE